MLFPQIQSISFCSLCHFADWWMANWLDSYSAFSLPTTQSYTTLHVIHLFAPLTYQRVACSSGLTTPTQSHSGGTAAVDQTRETRDNLLSLMSVNDAAQHVPQQRALCIGEGNVSLFITRLLALVGGTKRPRGGTNGHMFVLLNPRENQMYYCAKQCINAS